MYSVLDFGECSYPARCEFPSSGHRPNGLKTKRSPLFEKRNATLLHGSLLLHMAVRVHLTLSDEVDQFRLFQTQERSIGLDDHSLKAPSFMKSKMVRI